MEHLYNRDGWTVLVDHGKLLVTSMEVDGNATEFAMAISDDKAPGCAEVALAKALLIQHEAVVKLRGLLREAQRTTEGAIAAKNSTAIQRDDYAARMHAANERYDALRAEQHVLKERLSIAEHQVNDWMAIAQGRKDGKLSAALYRIRDRYQPIFDVLDELQSLLEEDDHE